MKKVKKVAKEIWNGVKWYLAGAVGAWCLFWGMVVAWVMLDVKLHPDKYNEEPE